MDATTMREFEALCLPPFKHHSGGQIDKLGLRYNASRAVLAAHFNIPGWRAAIVAPHAVPARVLQLK